MRTVLLTILTFICIGTTFSQPWLENLPKGKSPAELTLHDYQQAFESYWAPFAVDPATFKYERDGKPVKAAGYKQFKRWEYQMSFVVDPETGAFPQKTALEVREDFERQHPPSRSRSTANWSPMGPDYSNSGYSGIGRLNCIAFHPTDTNRYWVGAAAGGLWETKDNGETWEVLTDQNGVLAVSDIIIPTDFDVSGIIYIATGDRDGWDNRSIGVLKSTDGGASWQSTGLSFTLQNNQMVNRLLMDPADQNVLIAATTSGVFKTIDGGGTWDTQLSDREFIDLEYMPGSNTTIYGSTKGGEIHRSTDGHIFDLVLDDDDARRIELAVSPNQPNWVYALASNSNNGLHGIFKSIDGGANFLKVLSGDTLNLLTWSSDGEGDDGQGWYDLALASSPQDANIILVGGVNTWRSMDGGIHWTIVNHWVGSNSQAVHADKHQLKFRDNGDLFECNDGGVYLSKEQGINWVDRTNGIQISQMYKLGVSQTEPDEVITGLQDNGTKLYSGNSWYDARGGDGMECLIDYTDVNIQYNTVYYGRIDRTLNHWQNSKNITPRDNDGDVISGNWVTPYVVDPNNPNILYGGYGELWRTENRGDDWEEISNLGISGRIRSIAVAPSNSEVIYIAGNKALWKTTNTGETWENLTDSLPNFTNITYIAVKHDDENTLWVTTSGYGNPAVYESLDGGKSWTDISEGLPSIPIYAIVQNRQAHATIDLYIGTELGVYYKKGANDWEPYNEGLPNVKIGEIEIYYSGNPGESKLRAATYGRGLWETPVEYISTPMVYASTTAKQPNTSAISPDQIDQEILKVELQTLGNLSPLSVTSFTFNTNGSTDPTTDIISAKLYFSSTSNAFSTADQFGETVMSPSGEFTFTDTQELGDGRNNFWLTYDVPAEATIGNRLDAQCTSVIVDEPRDLVVSDPDGFRTISLKYCDAGATELTYEYISRVRMGTVDNNSGKDPGGYTDYSAVEVEASQGTSMDILVYNGVPFWADQVLIWVDWNVDGDFLDKGEEVFVSNPSGDDIFRCQIDIPATAKLGLTKMRIRLHDSQNGAHSEPCGFAQWGEVEDYSIRVIPFDPCARLNYFDYQATSIPGEYIDLDTNGMIITTSEFNDANSEPVDIGFSFEYMCQPFTQFVLNTNGFIKLGDTPPSTASMYFMSGGTEGGIFNSDDTADINILSPLNMNLVAGTGTPEYRVHTEGDAPYRICTIQYKDVREAPGSLEPQFDNMQFQIKLYETSNVIEFVYGDWMASGNEADEIAVACGLKGLSRANEQVLVASKTADQSWEDIGFVNSNFETPEAIFYSRPPESPQPDAGTTLRFKPTLPNDLAINEIYSMGEASLYFSSPQKVGVNVENIGLYGMKDIPVALVISGANTFADTVTIASLQPGENTTVYFSDFTPDSLGTTTVAVMLPGDGDNRNNEKTWLQEVTEFMCNYSSADAPDGGFGYSDDQDNMLLSKFNLSGTAALEAIHVFIDSNSVVDHQVHGVALDADGTLLWLSGGLTVQDSNLGTWHSFIVPENQPELNDSCYLGVLIFPGNDIKVGYQNEAPLRTGTFYFGFGNLYPLANPIRPMIGATLSSPAAIAGTASSDQTICEGTEASIQLEGSTGAIQWQSSPDGTDNWEDVMTGSGAASAAFTTDPLSQTTYYRAEVVQPTYDPVYSNTVTISVLSTPKNSGMLVGPDTICVGEEALFYLDTPMEFATSYQWTLHGDAQGNSDTDTLRVVFSAPTDTGLIRLAGWNDFCIGDSIVKEVFVRPQPVTPEITNADHILTSNAENGNQWYDEDGPIPGATDQEFIATYSGNFYVVVTENGCPSEPSNIIQVILSAVHTINTNPLLKVYPNPVSDNLYLQAEGSRRMIRYEIHDAVGQLVINGTFEEKTGLDIERLLPGVYFIRMNDQGISDVRRFVKE